MRVASLSVPELTGRLRKDGLAFRTGPFVVNLHSSISSVAHGLRLLYGQYPLAETPFADFHVSLERPAGLRRWYKPQVRFSFDGRKPFKPLPLAHAFPMFEWTLNWCVANHAHQYLIVHGAVVEKGGHVALMPAPPGSGKSTLCAALVNRGWRLFSDELALVSLLDGRLWPLPRPVNLKNESIDIIKAYAPDAVFGPTVADTNKGTVAHMRAPEASIARAGEAAAPGWIIMPRYVAGAEARLTPRSKARTGLELAQNSFNYNVLAASGFEAMTRLVDESDCYDFSYGYLDEAIALFDALEPPR